MLPNSKAALTAGDIRRSGCSESDSLCGESVRPRLDMTVVIVSVALIVNSEKLRVPGSNSLLELIRVVGLRVVIPILLGPSQTAVKAEQLDLRGLEKLSHRQHEGES
jgi:hypothetical protein